MKNGKIILIAYVTLFILTLYFGTQFADLILGFRFIDKADLLLFSMIPLKGLVGLIIAIAVTYYFYKGKSGYYLTELDVVVDELKKVVWPTKEETKITTSSVFVFVLIMMGILLALDSVWSKISSIVY